MFRLLSILFVSTMIMLSRSCERKMAEKQVTYYKNELEKIKKTDKYKDVINSFKDTLNAWLARDIKEVQDNLKNCDWQIADVVFFNKAQSRCLLLLLYVDWDTSDVWDHTQIIGAEKLYGDSSTLEGKWQFYYHLYPGVAFDRKDFVPSRPYTFDEMTNYMIKDLITDGYFFKGRCQINYSYIDSDIWFTDDRREAHYEDFLTNKWAERWGAP